MIFFYGEGRLGNQVFQYQALGAIARTGERVLAVGLEDLHGVLLLSGPPLRVIKAGRMRKRAFKFLINPLVLRPLAKSLRLFNYAAEGVFGDAPHAGANGELMFRAGVFKNFTFVDGGHYQNAGYWDSIFPAGRFDIKDTLKAAARRYLGTICPAPSKPVFVHVRRTDYLTHVDYGLKNLALPAGYYLGAMKHAADHISKIHWVFVTDDPGWVAENFKHVEDKTIASFDAAMDFAIMTECSAGVLSNSTFSLAAALMIKDPLMLLAPEHWNGFRVKRWFPPKICFRHPLLVYIPVTE